MRYFMSLIIIIIIVIKVTLTNDLVITSDAERSESSLALESLLLRSHMVTRDNAYLT